MDESADDFSLNEDATDKLLLAELANILSEVLQEEQTTHWEPFEAHAHQLKSHLQADGRTFRRRLMRGYEILLTTLAQEDQD
jgi:hypothetical protein